MRIRFTKGREKTNTMTCIRDDGSDAWTDLRSLPVPHDIIHYVVETTLGCRNAFYGLLNAGWDTKTFGEKDPVTGKTPALPQEAMQVECLVGILQTEIAGCTTPDDFYALLEMSCEGCGILPLAPAPEQLATIRREIRVLCEQWRRLLEGETMELVM